MHCSAGCTFLSTFLILMENATRAEIFFWRVTTKIISAFRMTVLWMVNEGGKGGEEVGIADHIYFEWNIPVIVRFPSKTALFPPEGIYRYEFHFRRLHRLLCLYID